MRRGILLLALLCLVMLRTIAARQHVHNLSLVWQALAAQKLPAVNLQPDNLFWLFWQTGVMLLCPWSSCLLSRFTAGSQIHGSQAVWTRHW